MAWRGLHLTEPSRLALADGQVVIAQEDGEVRIALEDRAWIGLDTPQSTLTGSLISACTAAGVALVATDETHAPCGVLLPFHRHFRQGEIAHRQAAMSSPLKKRLWQKIVRGKILNQAGALEATRRGGAHTLREMAHHVQSGDPGNVEARAARYYWTQFWPEFRRDNGGDKRNKLLNYGYAVLRSGVARSLVASGLLPAFGLHHASVTNPFNLADDVVEPFRPFVDVLAWRSSDRGRPSRGDLSLAERRLMAGALFVEAEFANETTTLLVASEKTAESLARSIEGSSAEILQLPGFAG